MKFAPIITFLLFLNINNLYAQWQEKPTPVGGYSLSMAEQNGVLFSASYSHVFRSFDGEVWSRVEALPYEDDFNRNYQLQTAGNRLYAIWYEAFAAPTSVVAVYYTEDAGEHWEEYPLQPNTTRIFFLGERLFWLRDDNRLFFIGDNGLESPWWEPLPNKLLDMEMKNDTAYLLSTYDLSFSTDTGRTWTPMFAGFQLNPNAPETVLYTAGSNLIIGSWVTESVSTDGGHFFVPIAPENIYGRFYDMVAYQGKLYGARSSVIQVSSDGGLNWETDVRIPALAFLVRGDTLWAGSFDGIFRTTDGEHWTFCSKNILDQYSGAMSEVLPFDGGMAVLSTNDVLYVSRDDGQTFDFVTFGAHGPMIATDNGYVLASPFRYRLSDGFLDTIPYPGIPEYFYYNYSYGEGQLLATRDYMNRFWRSLDDGTTWDSIPLGSTEFPGNAGISGNRLLVTYTESGLVQKSDDLGQTWSNFMSGLSGDDLPYLNKFLYQTGDGLMLKAQDSTYRYTPAGWKAWSSSKVRWTGGDGISFGSGVQPEPQLWMRSNDGTLSARLDGSNPSLNLSLPLAYHDHVLYGIGESAESDLHYAVIYSLPVAGANGIVSGNVFVDANSNGVFDTDEAPLEGSIVSAKLLGAVTSTNPAGDYTFLVWQPGDTIRAQLPSPHYTSQPPYHLVGQSGAVLDFAMQPKPDEQDYVIHATPHFVFRPGFNTNITLACNNPGTVNAPLTVKVVLPDFIDYQTAAPLPDVVDGDTLWWNLPGIASLSVSNILLTVKPEVLAVLGSPIEIRAEIGPIETDLVPADNVNVLQDVLLAAYDPNDKAVFPESLTPAQLSAGTALTYRVRFQNTGTFPATFVHVLDTLSNDLDISTLHVLASSHPMTWQLRENQILDFFFDNINLPDSSSNEPESHGFVLFSVQPRAGLAIGTSIPNQAAIYFDYNVPVFTNFAEMQVKQSVGTGAVSLSTDGMYLAPNPASNVVRVFFEEKTAAHTLLRLFDAQGRMVLEKTVGTGQEVCTLDVSGLSAGTYVVKVAGKAGAVLVKD
ncbi:MAG: T9SS type A sorting domain-containing protein [Saprospiraceae bacterium]|nr:T9SS type A sorting domain-containing protein [Saprospiraceae bacterium]